MLGKANASISMFMSIYCFRIFGAMAAFQTLFLLSLHQRSSNKNNHSVSVLEQIHLRVISTKRIFFIKSIQIRSVFKKDNN